MKATISSTLQDEIGYSRFLAGVTQVAGGHDRQAATG
jgi:hypothetical protein